MSKWMWILGAGTGALALASMGKGKASGGGKGPSEDEKPKPDDTTPKGGEDPSAGDDSPTTGDTPAGGDIPTKGGGTPPVVEPKPPSEDPWVPLPYDSYERGPYSIDLTGLSTGVRWRVWATAAAPNTDAAKDTVKLGADVEQTDEDARLAANTFVDHLGVLPVEPYPLPPKPTPDGVTGPDGNPAPVPPVSPTPFVMTKPATLVASTPDKQAHGLNVSADCTTITVDSIVSWIAWAEPWVRQRVKTMSRTALVQGLLEATFPDCAWNLDAVTVVGGRRLLMTLAEVDQRFFTKERAGTPWPGSTPFEPLPLERAVAELVGSVAPPIAIPEFAHRGYHVDLEPTAHGWRWAAWRRGKHPGAPDFTGGPEPTAGMAVLAAKTTITTLGA